jgi:hypothetical protein
MPIWPSLPRLCPFAHIVLASDLNHLAYSSWIGRIEICLTSLWLAGSTELVWSLVSKRFPWLSTIQEVPGSNVVATRFDTLWAIYKAQRTSSSSLFTPKRVPYSVYRRNSNGGIILKGIPWCLISKISLLMNFFPPPPPHSFTSLPSFLSTDWNPGISA